MVSHSSTEAEYKTMTDATFEIMWVQTGLQELQVPRSWTARLWCDNMRAKYLTCNHIFTGQ
jgi:hypothetical protein